MLENTASLFHLLSKLCLHVRDRGFFDIIGDVINPHEHLSIKNNKRLIKYSEQFDFLRFGTPYVSAKFQIFRFKYQGQEKNFRMC